MNKMVINQHDKLFVTNDAATIIRELDVVHPAAKMVVMAANMQEQEVPICSRSRVHELRLISHFAQCGDNTNLVVSLAGELLVQAESLIRMGLHPSEIIAGYTKAAQHASELLEGLNPSFSLSFRQPLPMHLVARMHDAHHYQHH